MLRATLLVLSLLSFAAEAVRHGDAVDWKRHAYLAKILVNGPEDKGVSACTGTLVSPTSIITSAKCFEDARQAGETVEAIAIISVPKRNTTLKMKVLDVTVNGEIALVAISEFTNNLMCEGKNMLPRISHLNLRPSLVKPSWTAVDVGALAEKKCRLTAFNTTEPEEFSNKHIVMQVQIDDLQDEEDSVLVQVDKGRGACWDDIGAPLECQLSPDNGPYIQVGFLISTQIEAKPDIKENEVPKTESSSNTDKCSLVQAMRFILFSNDDLPNLLEKDRVNIVRTYFHCFD